MPKIGSLGRRRSPLAAEAEMYLRRFVASRHPTTEEAIAWIYEQWGVSYSLTGARTVLLRIGAVMPHGSLRGSARRWDVPEAIAARERMWAKQRKNERHVSYC